MCSVQVLRSRDLVEHERIVEVELALDGDLRHAPASGPEPALSHSSTEPPGSSATTSTPLASCLSSSGVPLSNGKVP